MTDVVARLTERYFGQKAVSIQPLGGGFYGRVFAVQLVRAPHRLAIKTYLFGGLHRREQEHLAILATHATLHMPTVYVAHDADAEIPVDALIMEYLEGINAGKIGEIAAQERERIADQIVENLIAYHSATHPEGFGEINGATFETNWREQYRERAASNHRKALGLHARGQIGDAVLRVVDRAQERYDAIFSEPIEVARLIHGDYNTWNVLLNQEATEAVGVIDPFNCSWADSELDLYQLNNANGRYFNLLEKYMARVKVSRNFAIKSCFYELFSEIMHFYDANVDASNSALPEQAARLEAAMNAHDL